MRNLILLLPLITLLLLQACDEPTPKNGHCASCTLNVNFDRTVCANNPTEKYFKITINQDSKSQEWLRSASEYPGGVVSFDIICGEYVSITYIVECHYENGHISQFKDVRRIAPQNCSEDVFMMPQRGY